MSEANRSFAEEPRFVKGRSLPALAMPKGKEDTRWSALLSVLLHVLVIALLVTPFAAHELIMEREQGAGGPGPAGGGGGGRRGTGGDLRQPRERLRFIVVHPQPVATPKAVPPPPQPQPKPVVTPPVIPPPTPVEVKQPDPPKVEKTQEAAKPPTEVALVPGTGGGTGNDGTSGSGPGSGGGVGSGVGTGRGSGVGPGTGGGNQANYPPAPIELFVPPLPVPNKVKGFHLIAEFDVDELGRVMGFDFNETRDGDYNKKLRDLFKGYRFRPGTRPDGTPIRMKAQIAWDLF